MHAIPFTFEARDTGRFTQATNFAGDEVQFNYFGSGWWHKLPAYYC